MKLCLKTACTPCHDDSRRTSALSVLSTNSLLSGDARQGAAVTQGNPRACRRWISDSARSPTRFPSCTCSVWTIEPSLYLHEGRYKRLTDTGESVLKEIFS